MDLLLIRGCLARCKIHELADLVGPSRRNLSTPHHHHALTFHQTCPDSSIGRTHHGQHPRLRNSEKVHNQSHRVSTYISSLVDRAVVLVAQAGCTVNVSKQL